LRTAMRLLAVSRRSIEAIRRPNSVLEGRRPMDAVLDMDVPFLKWRSSSASRSGTIYVYQIPQTISLFAWQQLAECIATKMQRLAFHIEKGRRNPAASVSQNIRSAYSAACFRGGSSAPESWISAT